MRSVIPILIQVLAATRYTEAEEGVSYAQQEPRMSQGRGLTGPTMAAPAPNAPFFANPPMTTGGNLPFGQTGQIGNPYVEFFGRGRMARNVWDPKNRSMEVMNLQDSYDNLAIPQITEAIIRIMTAEDLFWVRAGDGILPWMRNDSDNQIAWSSISYHDHMLDEDPDQGVPRVVSFERQQSARAFNVYGKAMLMEFRFYQTEAGREMYNMHLLQMANATNELACYSVAMELLRTKDPTISDLTVGIRDNTTVTTRLQAIQREINLFGIVQRPDGLETLMTEVRRVMGARGVVPTDVILPMGALTEARLANLTPDARGDMVNAAGVRYNESRQFIINKFDTEDPFDSEAQIGSFIFFDSLPTMNAGANYRTYMRDIKTWCEDKNNYEHIPFQHAIDNCGIWEPGQDQGLSELGLKMGYETWRQYLGAEYYDRWALSTGADSVPFRDLVREEAKIIQADEMKRIRERIQRGEDPTELTASGAYESEQSVREVLAVYGVEDDARQLATALGVEILRKRRQQGASWTEEAAQGMARAFMRDKGLFNEDRLVRLVAATSAIDAYDLDLSLDDLESKTGDLDLQVLSVDLPEENKMELDGNKTPYDKIEGTLVNFLAGVIGPGKDVVDYSAMTGIPFSVNLPRICARLNIPCPANFIGFIPHQRWVTGSMVALNRNGLGNTYFGHPSFLTSINTTIKAIQGHFRTNMAAVVRNPKQLEVIRNVILRRYDGGLNTNPSKTFKYDADTLAAYRDKDTSGNSVFYCMVPGHWRPNGNVLDLTGQVPWASNIRQGQPDGSWPGADRYAAYWGWVHSSDPLGLMYDHPDMELPYNTVCYSFYQQYFQWNGGNGEWVTQVNTGHLGNAIYPGAASVRQPQGPPTYDKVAYNDTRAR